MNSEEESTTILLLAVMIFNKFVELGRVVFIAKGKDEGKLAVVVDVLDGNRVSNGGLERLKNVPLLL